MGLEKCEVMLIFFIIFHDHILVFYGDCARKTENMNIKLKMSLGVKNESNKRHDTLPIRFPVFERKIVTDGLARRKVSW